jgi:hypothetical protein
MPSLLDDCILVADVNGHTCLFNVTTGRPVLLGHAAQRLIVPLLGRDVSAGDLTADPAVRGVIAALVDQGAVAHSLSLEFKASTGD